MAARCWASMYVLPFQSHVGPQQKVQCGMKENCHPGELPWGSACSSREAPFTFGYNLQPGFQFFPCARAGPRAVAVEDEGLGLPGVLVSAQHTVILLPDPRHAARGHYLSANVIVRCQVPPHHQVAHTCSQNKVVAGRSAACWPGTRPLQLLTVYCHDLTVIQLLLSHFKGNPEFKRRIFTISKCFVQSYRNVSWYTGPAYMDCLLSTR